MVIQRIMLSPCMICENEDIYDWTLLDKTLDFINEYLECGLDSVEGSIFHEDSWYTPPACTLNMYSFFTTNIFPKLQNLLCKGSEYRLSDLEQIDTYSVKNPDFIITHFEEMELLARYTANIRQDYILFVGKPNYKLNSNILDL